MSDNITNQFKKSKEARSDCRSERIRMDPNRSENLEKLAKSSKNFVMYLLRTCLVW